VAHKDICIKFEVDGRRYEAVGFLGKGESSISGDEMLRRVPDAIGEEDVNFLDERVDQDWSRDMFPYCLATARRNPDNPRSVRCFSWKSFGGWHQGWSRLGRQWDGDDLVLRRRA
jgi:hypothetical protein